MSAADYVLVAISLAILVYLIAVVIRAGRSL
jgi:hypothetical protein